MQPGKLPSNVSPTAPRFLRCAWLAYAAAAAGALCLPALPAAAHHDKMPAGFVRLADVAPDIRQDMRYAGSDNVLGRPLKGYKGPACILTTKAAEALVAVQARLKPKGLTLIVFDCFRPISAVDDLVAWTKAGGGPDPRWHPGVRRGDLIDKGYVGLRSSHSRGSTVDIAIGRSDAGAAPAVPACGAAAPGMLDFGTGFDCFDEASRTDSPLASTSARANRAMLVEAMSAAGFKNYAGEWWHFTLREEPYPEKRFGFEVK